MKQQKTLLFLGICLSAVLGFSGCSSDDEPNEPTVEIKMGNEYQETVYTPVATFKKPILFSEPVETPKPEDFTFVSETNQTKVFHLDWDITEPAKDVNTSEAKLTVTNVEAVGNLATGYTLYTLTISCDVSKFMTASMDKVQIVYKKKSKTSNSFDFSYKGCAQKVVRQLPMQTYKLEEIPTSAKIELQSAYNQLGISPSEVHGVEGRHCIYGSLHEEGIDLNSEFHMQGQKDITFSADYEGMRPVLTIHGLDKFEPDVEHYVQLIFSFGQNQYAAINVPIVIWSR